MSSVIPKSIGGQLRLARTQLEAELRAGGEARAERWLAEFPAVAADSESALELVYTEFVLRQELGQNPTADEWYQRFPHWKSDLEQMFQIHEALVKAENSLTGGASRGPGARQHTITHGSGPLTPRRSRWLTSIPGYTLEEEIGRGGMGVVYKARQSSLNRVVALKVILSGPYAGQKELDRFRREAEAAARLDHPNIVRIYEVGESDGRPYCSMEYVGGGTLAAHLGTPWTPERAAAFVATLARAVQHAHDRGIVHRDLKPANILLAVGSGQWAVGSQEEDQQQLSSLPTAHCPLPTAPKIADFGLAKLLTDSDTGPTLSGDILGTPSYMAPEQAEGRASGIGPHTDVWALGVLLYELLTGRQPFQGDSQAAIINSVKTIEPVPPRQLCPKLPRDLQTICLKCLNKAAGSRYLSAARMADDLERWLRGDSIHARPISTVGRVRRWCGRNPRVAALLACLAVVTVVGIAGILWQWHQANERRDEAVFAERQARAERANAEDRLYASLIAQAALELAAGRTSSAEGILEACGGTDPALRNWEWRYLKRQCQKHVLTLAGHTQPVNSIAYSPDGLLMISGAGHFNGIVPGEVFLWDAIIGKRVAQLNGPTATVNAVAFHPSGEWIAAACKDGKVYRWELRDLDHPLAYPFGFGVNSIAFHPDGKTVAICGPRSVFVWDLESPQPTSIARTNTDNVFDVTFSPDGRYLASASRDGSVTIRSTGDYRIVCERFHRSDVKRVAFSPDGRLLASTSYDGGVILWDIAEGFKRLETHQIGYSNGLDLAYRPDSVQYAVTTQNAGVHVWYQKGQREDYTVVPSTGRNSGLAFSPDSRWVATAQEDHAIRVWDVTPQENPRSVTTQGAWAAALALSPDGKLVAIAGGFNRSHGGGLRTARVFDYPSLRLRGELRGHPGWLTAVAFRPDGEQLASGDEAGVAKLWNAATGQHQHDLTGHAGEIHALAYRPGHTQLASAGADKSVRVWDSTAGTEVVRLDHPDRVHAVAYSSDGRTLATGCADHMVRLWDAETHRLIRTLSGHEARVDSLAFQPHTTLLASADEEQQLLFWETETGTPLTTPDRGNNNEADDDPPDRRAERCRTSLAFSPDGRRLAFAKTPQLLQVWDPKSRRPVMSFTASDYVDVQCTAFSADGHQLLATNRRDLRIWDSTEVDGRDRVRQAREPAARAKWHSDRMTTYLDFREWWSAEYHATRAIAEAPTVRLYSVREMARAALGKFESAVADHHAALALSGQSTWYGRFAVPGPALLWTMTGEGCAYRGRWDRAEQAYAVALLSEPDNPVHWNNLASLHLARGRGDRFRDLCQRMLGRFGATKSPNVAFQVVSIATVAPVPDRATQLVELANLAVKASPNVVRARAAANYRAGRFAESLQDSVDAERFGRPSKSELAFRAMTLYQLGRTEQARVWLDRARALTVEADRLEAVPTAWGDGRWRHWNEQAEVKALLQEASSLIDAR